MLSIIEAISVRSCDTSTPAVFRERDHADPKNRAKGRMLTSCRSAVGAYDEIANGLVKLLQFERLPQHEVDDIVAVADFRIAR